MLQSSGDFANMNTFFSKRRHTFAFAVAVVLGIVSPIDSHSAHILVKITQSTWPIGSMGS